MDPLARTAVEVLERHPAPALPMEELQRLVARERPHAVPGANALLRSLRRLDRRVRMLEADEDRLGAVGSHRWVLVQPRDSTTPPRSLTGRMRESLRGLGAALEPGSNLALARWARLLAEERKVRRALCCLNGLPPAPGA